MTSQTLPLAAALGLVLAAPVAAGEAQDRIFRVGLLDPVETGQSLVYRHDRTGELTAEAVPPIEEGSMELALLPGDGSGRTARVELIDDGEPRSRAVLSAGGGHPIMLIFLETSARNMAELTGGSPFYIRNRMREALAEDVAVEPVDLAVAGETVAAEAITFRPFRDDPNRAAMGAFADLALTMTLSEDVPGGFARFEAAAGAGAEGDSAYTETIVFDHLAEE